MKKKIISHVPLLNRFLSTNNKLKWIKVLMINHDMYIIKRKLYFNSQIPTRFSALKNTIKIITLYPYPILAFVHNFMDFNFWCETFIGFHQIPGQKFFCDFSIFSNSVLFEKLQKIHKIFLSPISVCKEIMTQKCKNRVHLMTSRIIFEIQAKVDPNIDFFQRHSVT